MIDASRVRSDVSSTQYGLLYHSTFIGRAGPKHKGRISRFLANKCSLAARIDCFSGEPFATSEKLRFSVTACISELIHSPSFVTEKPSVRFGEALRDQVEERLRFFETGEPPSKNAEAIRKVLEAIALESTEQEGSDDEEEDEDEGGMKVDDTPRKDSAGFSILPLIENSPPPASPMKKSKKRKGNDMDVDEEEEEAPRKKTKLSKEEKKALKKELRQKRKEEEKAAGVRSSSFFHFFLRS